MYPHIHHKLYGQPWAITPAAFDSIHQTFQAAVAARFGARSHAPAAVFDMPDQDEASAAPQLLPTVAVVPIHGIIGKRLSSLETLCGGCDVDAIRAALDAAAAEPAIETIVLSVHSPGGAVTGVPELADRIHAISAGSGKEVIAYTDTLMASAGYWLASQAHAIYAAPSAIVGSIGVIVTYLDQSRHDDQEGLAYTTVKSGEFKDTGNPHRALTDTELARIRSEVMALYGDFVTAISRTRSDIPSSALQGEVYRGPEAQSLNLIDGAYPTLASLLADL